MVIPTRADGRGLETAVDSVLRQTGVRVTLVVVVDGRTAVADAGPIRALGGRHRVVWADRHGRPGPLRNVGVALAETPWIAFLDDDDEWVDDKLERQLAVARASGAVVIGSDATAVHENEPAGPYLGEDCPASLRLNDAVKTNWLITSSVVASTRAMRRAGGFPLEPSMRFCDDYVAWLRLLTLGEGRILKEELVKYSVGSPNSLSMADEASGREVRSLALRHLLHDVESFDLPLSRKARHLIMELAGDE